jgi:hemerythrin-like domain-containing protein
MAIDLFETLYAEHRFINQALQAFDSYATSVALGPEFDRHDLNRFVFFFSQYAELGHHHKEENVLIPALVACGFAAPGGPLEFIRDQHRHERRLMRRLRRSAAQKEPWSNDNRRDVVKTIRQFVSFERTHMEKENTLLFPEAIKQLHGEPRRQASIQLEEMQSAWDEDGYSAWLRSLGEQLIADHAPSAADTEDKSS